MSRQTDYLEHPGAGKGARFYEVVREGRSVTTTYGPVGKAGRTKTVEYPTERKAVAAAAKKVHEKIVIDRFVRAAKGVGLGKPDQAPVLWRFRRPGPRAFGLFADKRGCWVGNQWGEVFELGHDGAVTAKFKLPHGVKCIVADDLWIYAGCDDGRVYDLSGKVPRVAYEIPEGGGVSWLDVEDGTLGVSLKNGGVSLIDHEGDLRWSRGSEGREGWMVRCEGDALYYGDSKGVSRFQTEDGTPVWNTPLPSDVLFGWPEGGEVYRLAKGTGEPLVVYPCDAPVFSCATAPDARFVFAGDNHSGVYCFARSGERLWKLTTGCGSAQSMQYHDGRLYIVTTTGTLACIDVTEEAVLAARGGTLPEAVDLEAAAEDGVEPGSLQSASPEEGGVILECFEDGSRLRVRILSPGYEPSWNVQFPRESRVAGARYLVEGVQPAARGGFYRVYGDIRRLR